MPRLVGDAQVERYWTARKKGLSQRDAAAKGGFSLTKARQLEADRKTNPTRQDALQRVYTGGAGDPVPYEQLGPEAQRAWDDFPYFQRRYFGRVPLPWQEEAAYTAIDSLKSGHEDYIVCNAPPGHGKTLLFTHDLPAWLIVRDRGIRILLGAITGRLAENYTDRLRHTLMRTIPVQGKLQEVLAGAAYDAVATLAGDFGRFQPLGVGVWTKAAFTVAQYGDVAPTEKEPTCQGYGFDSEFIGNRVDFCNWDDLVDPRKQRANIEMVEKLRDDWDNLAETRLEPWGTMMLTGQRLAGNDLYRYALDKEIPDEIDPATGLVETWRPKYQHIVYPVHWEDRCTPEGHLPGAKAYPEGCMLAPNRMDYAKMKGAERNNLAFQTIYMQEDVDPMQVLVPKNWIYGDDTHLGCVDRDRDILDVPRNEAGQCLWAGPLWSYMTVDPSPDRYWGIQWWVYQHPSLLRHLIDLEKRRMRADDFLDYNPETGTYFGLLEEWHQTSKKMGLPITHLIVEINAAQRFMLQYKFFTDWARTRGVTIVPHTTHRNKTDPEYGVWTVREQWQFGRIRLPWKAHSEGKAKSQRFIDEVTRYPGSDTDDLIMAHWFGEFNLPRLFRPETDPSQQWRPKWVNENRYERLYR